MKKLLVLLLCLVLCTSTLLLTACGKDDEVPNDGESEGTGGGDGGDSGDTEHVHTPDSSGYCTGCDEPISATEGIKYELSSDGTFATVVSYEGKSDRVIIASEYEGVPVIGIGVSAFMYKPITGVIIPDSVTIIGDDAFYGCSSLTSVTIPKSVTSIGVRAFSYCSCLEKITVSDGNSKYHSSGNCLIETNSKTLVLGCANSIIPSDGSVTSIGDYAFRACYGLSSIVIPDSVTRIKNGAFVECINLVSVTIGEGVTAIDGGTIFEDGMYIHVVDAFLGCEKLIEVINKSALDITAGSKSYGRVAYYAKEVHTGGSKIVNLNDFIFYSFKGTNYLLGYVGADRAIILPESYNYENYAIYDYAFAGCKFIEVFSYKYPGCVDLTAVTIPNGVTSIGNFSFCGCENLTSVTIPNSVKSIGDGAFWGCYKLVEVINKSSLDIAAGSESHGCVAYYAKEVHTGESKIVNVDDYLFYTCNGENYLLGYLGDGKSLALPESYNGERYAIHDYAFFGRDDVTSATVPGGVISIGYAAFVGCSRLATVNISDGFTSIGEQAFYGCTSLTSITIPNSVTDIGISAFENCSSLTSVTFENMEGWNVIAMSDDAETSISSSDLSDVSTAAEYLTSTHCYKEWKRS